jgi:hypothetical protein
MANFRDSAKVMEGLVTRCELRWLVSFSGSCMHAADAIAAGARLIDPQLASKLEPPALALRNEIQGLELPEDRCWRWLNALAYHFENNRELAATMLRKATGQPHETLVTLLAGRITELESTMQREVPKMVDELELRGGPIRDLWEAYGPGMLATIGRMTDEHVIVSQADVVLVHPVLGGGGAAHLMNNSVRLEAVLTNNVPQLPEVVRLGWLLSQLHLDVPQFGELVPADRLPHVASLAMLPPALYAAQELGLCSSDRETLELALSSWRLRSGSEAIAETLELWWETYQAVPTSWSTALAALDQMLTPPPTSRADDLIGH